ncbi:6-carboxytetrahydropterin synthase QueD [Lacrimispora amygdalina]|uniref:6-carboxy-5,6,7,8-tetrahydropterin synthase n=1 Tax=Lacrimispora amygdalina TaxID=253257 RepID=A0A3E2ND02_9FIRM|nr:6-carboxytetrahydropterin synthase [Clostridium indicum]RFZ78875.1 6-carboxytetrahydropterin synthase [Clostridium indicum]
MYYLETEQSFDSAHFLKGYEGKCKNIHGHRWRVVIEIQSPSLQKEGQTQGMIVDFSRLKEDLKEETDYLDHSLILEKGSLRPETLLALKEEGFLLVEVNFRPTAEGFSRYFYEKMSEKGYNVKSARVYETPANSASYGEDSHG